MLVCSSTSVSACRAASSSSRGALVNGCSASAVNTWRSSRSEASSSARRRPRALSDSASKRSRGAPTVTYVPGRVTCDHTRMPSRSSPERATNSNELSSGSKRNTRTASGRRPARSLSSRAWCTNSASNRSRPLTENAVGIPHNDHRVAGFLTARRRTPSGAGPNGCTSRALAGFSRLARRGAGIASTSSPKRPATGARGSPVAEANIACRRLVRQAGLHRPTTIATQLG